MMMHGRLLACTTALLLTLQLIAPIAPANAIYLPTIFNSRSGETRPVASTQAERRIRARRAGSDRDCSTIHFSGPGCKSTAGPYTTSPWPAQLS